MANELLPWQQRVVDEKCELDAKREKLEAFIPTREFGMLNKYDKELLLSQRSIMAAYSIVLSLRIARMNDQ